VGRIVARFSHKNKSNEQITNWLVHEIARRAQFMRNRAFADPDSPSRPANQQKCPASISNPVLGEEAKLAYIREYLDSPPRRHTSRVERFLETRRQMEQVLGSR